MQTAEKNRQPTDGCNLAIRSEYDRSEYDLTDDASLTYKPFGGYWGGGSTVLSEAQGPW